nr:Transposon TX1 uncharacterized [Cajanus cajan]KYP39966.1 Transposon TX1 uncharacterized [Cajanus cajan]
MHADKAPGLDGLNPGFYKHFWELLGPEIYHVGKQWLEQGFFPEPLNQTNIVLIPKTDTPSSMKDLRPISVCNVIYKSLKSSCKSAQKCATPMHLPNPICIC